jgi:hypothetical protein
MPLDRDRLARVLGHALLTPPNRRSADQRFLIGYFLLGPGELLKDEGPETSPSPSPAPRNHPLSS